MIFCPTGGIDAQKAGNYFALANVACVGGSWMVGAGAYRGAGFCQGRTTRAESVRSWRPPLRGQENGRDRGRSCPPSDHRRLSQHEL
ncbi:MAG TPA: hypothetical protein VIH87_00010 [Methylocella sp.]